MNVLINILEIALEVAPWLFGGLVIAGVIKGWIPEHRLAAWLGGPGIGPIARGAVLGAPLPLCSCGAIPTGIALHRGGASRGATTAFMVGTPGIGIDSLALTYALMGPFMAILRPLGAVGSALATGLLVACAPGRAITADTGDTTEDACCDDDCCGASANNKESSHSPLQRTREGLGYAFADVLEDTGPWMLLGIALAGALVTWAPPESIVEYGSGFGAMLVMAVIGIPLYLCAQAATPIAAAMIIAGISPGTALVFLLAAPMTSLATLAVLRREFGLAPVGVYAATIGVTSIAIGLAADGLVSYFAINVTAQVGEVQDIFPKWFAYLALGALFVIYFAPALRRWFKF